MPRGQPPAARSPGHEPARTASRGPPPPARSAAANERPWTGSGVATGPPAATPLRSNSVGIKSTGWANTGWRTPAATPGAATSSGTCDSSGDSVQ